MSPRLSLVAAAVASALGAGACYDPVHLDGVAALGSEAPGVAPGPNHRPGQPCLTCHGGDGPADLEFSAAGTLYAVRGQPTPLAGAKVTLTDGFGEPRSFRTNEAGNFFVTRREWDLAFPLAATIEADSVRREMTTSIGRDGSCASCHRLSAQPPPGGDNGDATHMPGIFLRDK